MTRRTSLSLRLGLVLGATVALSACNDTELPGFLAGGGGETTEPAGQASAGVEREVEAPEVFEVTDKGLWDGRPSLGGIWVAHPKVDDPQRVIIRNQTNGQSVVGVIYRPERAQPGPKIQVSSDAAAALKILAGQPTDLSVVALQRVTVPEPEPAPKTEPAPAPAPASSAARSPAEVAQQALATRPSQPSVAAAAVTPAAAAAARGTPPAGASTAFIEVGAFPVEKNATDTAAALAKVGMSANVLKTSAGGKPVWRVVIGPVASERERNRLLRKAQRLGFRDARAVAG